MPYQVIYSETSGKIIRRLHPSIKPLIRQKIDAFGRILFWAKHWNGN